MSRENQKDERRFNFCIRCLETGAVLTEHHLRGRKVDLGDVVFICKTCHQCVDGPVHSESNILYDKKSLLISSTSLEWVIKNKDNVILSFQKNNRSGPSSVFGFGYNGYFGAIGNSGRRYFFIHPDYIDSFVGIPLDINPQEDGIGGPAGGGNWMRFKGKEDNILNVFIKHHQKHDPPVIDIRELEQ